MKSTYPIWLLSFLRLLLVPACFGVGLAEIIDAAEPKAEQPGVVTTKPTDGIFVEFEGKYLVPYQAKIPGTEVGFEMIPVPGGKFLMGSPAGEEGRGADEGPQVEVEVAPFWIGKTELTWAEYKKFMGTYSIFKKLKSTGVRKVSSANQSDAITAPTPLYEPSHTFEHGDDPMQPAVTMTQYAAKQYTKWLSGLTGSQYRLPSEAEWEYAARAGSQYAYSYGDDPEQLKDYACFEGNNEDGPAKVGLKKPNKFGLHDMHGNAWEWTIDTYTADGFIGLGKGPLTSDKAIQWPTKAYPRTARGGGWQDPPEKCRSASRLGSDDEEWKSEDPNVPKSPWWYTTDPARSVGMRLARSAKLLDKDTIKKYWDIDNDDIQLDVELRIEEGRGAVGLPVPELADDLRDVK